MKSESAVKTQKESPKPWVLSDVEASFLSELTSLSQKYRLGIAGDPYLFLMEWDDNGRTYSCDNESHLAFR